MTETITTIDRSGEVFGELAQCLKSMEASRKQYEADALRYRGQIEKSEKESDTLRFKIGDIQKNWEEMHQAQQDIQKSGNGKTKTPAKAPASAPAKAPTPFGLKEPDGESVREHMTRPQNTKARRTWLRVFGNLQ